MTTLTNTEITVLLTIDREHGKPHGGYGALEAVEKALKLGRPSTVAMLAAMTECGLLRRRGNDWHVTEFAAREIMDAFMEGRVSNVPDSLIRWVFDLAKNA